VIAADQHVGDKGRWKDIALRLEQLLASSSERDLPIGSEKNEMRRIFLPFAAIVSMTVSAFGAPDERILGKKGWVSNRHNFQLVLRRARTGWIVQQSRQN
jgi:hypothetical protein